MSSISIIGPGNMARILATRALAGGNTVEITGRDAAKAAALASELGGGATAGTTGSAPAGDIVVPSPCRTPPPYRSLVSTGTRWPARSSSISATSSIRPGPAWTPWTVSPGREQIAQVARAGAHVVKAFNTLFGVVLAADKAGGSPLDVFIAGDDAAGQGARVGVHRKPRYAPTGCRRPEDGALAGRSRPADGRPPVSVKPSTTTTSGSASTHSAEREGTALDAATPPAFLRCSAPLHP